MLVQGYRRLTEADAPRARIGESMELGNKWAKFHAIAQRRNTLDVEHAARCVTTLTEDDGLSQTAHIRPHPCQSHDTAAITCGVVETSTGRIYEQLVTDFQRRGLRPA